MSLSFNRIYLASKLFKRGVDNNIVNHYNIINKMKTKEISLEEIQQYARALHCPTRWRIIRSLGEGNKSTSEVEDYLTEGCQRMGKPNLYYHLSELSSVGIIEVAEYREEGGGAPEKVWKLAVEKLIIDLLEDGVKEECQS